MKKFKGFTPDQQHVLLTKMGYAGPKDPKMMGDFVASTPGADSKLADYARMAQARLSGKPPVEMASGGFLQNMVSAASSGTVTNNQGTSSGVPTAQEGSPGNLATQAAITTPQELITQAEAAKVPVTQDQLIKEDAGQVTGEVKADVSKVEDVATAQAPQKIESETVDASLVTPKVETALEETKAATAEPSKKATVQGQLEGLMQDFEGGATPVWASGAMRQAMGIMQARGLGASSMAGQAVVQAAMESALSIASADASTQAQFEMQNLNNEQQTMIFKTQQRVTGLLSDQAQENAAAQFNAANKNQVNMFFAGLEESVSKFNAEMVNAITKFNAGEENSASQFNAQIQNMRDQFNAQNSLIIQQANAKWRQDIATVDTAAQNEVNLTNAKNATGLTMAALDELWQTERDLLAMAYNSYESKLDRDAQLLLANKNLKAESDAGKGALLGTIAGAVVKKWF